MILLAHIAELASLAHNAPTLAISPAVMAAPAPAVARLTATVIRIWVVISPAIFAVSSLRARPYQVILLMIQMEKLK